MNLRENFFGYFLAACFVVGVPWLIYDVSIQIYRYCNHDQIELTKVEKEINNYPNLISRLVKMEVGVLAEINFSKIENPTQSDRLFYLAAVAKDQEFKESIIKQVTGNYKRNLKKRLELLDKLEQKKNDKDFKDK